MRYRRLTKEELEALQPEFLQFIITNGVMPDDWRLLVEGDTEKAEKLLGLFSDVVFEKVLGKIDYLEHREQKALKMFAFQPDKIILIGVTIQESDPADLTSDDAISKLIAAASRGAASIYSIDKPYNKERNTEIFNLMQAGATIGDSTWFSALEELYQQAN